jgi:hypothetical protein
VGPGVHLQHVIIIIIIIIIIIVVVVLALPAQVRQWAT